MIQQIISFDLCGKTAHFRKFYSSSSALSYSIPPKTTVLGIIGAIINLQRDSYYDLFDDWLIGVEVINPFRKIFQKMNFLKVEGNVNFNVGFEQSVFNRDSDITGSGNRTQTSFEILIPENIRDGELRFKIYVAVKDKEDRNFISLIGALKKKESVYGISLGSAGMLGYVKNFVEDYSFIPLSKGDVTNMGTGTNDDDITLMQDAEMIVEQDIFPVKMKLTQTNETKVSTRIAEEVKSLVYPITSRGMAVSIINSSHFYKLNGEDKSIALI